MTDRCKDDYEKPWGIGGVRRDREKEKRGGGGERREENWQDYEMISILLIPRAKTIRNLVSPR